MTIEDRGIVHLDLDKGIAADGLNLEVGEARRLPGGGEALRWLNRDC
jgi:hypothetical protein